MKENISEQRGATIRAMHPSPVAQARIYSEEQRMAILQLIRHNFLPTHTAVGKGKSTRKHWNIEKYRGKHGAGFKMITTSPYSSNFNHLTYVIIRDFCGGWLNIIHLTKEEVEASEKYDDFEEFLSTLEDKYGFRLKDCQWMTTETLKICRYEDGKEVV